MKFSLRLILLCLILPSCATLTRGSSQEFIIITNPPGAYIETSHGYYCVSPCKLSLPRINKFTVTARLNGFSDEYASVSNNSGGVGVSAGNILIGGLIGIGTDATSGALKDLFPNPLIINFTREVKSKETIKKDKKLVDQEKLDQLYIKNIQKDLKNLLYYSGPINGVFNQEVLDALLDFLYDEGLLEDSRGYYNGVGWSKSYNFLKILQSKFFQETLKNAILRRQ